MGAYADHRPAHLRPYTLVESARANDLEPVRHLALVFEQLTTGSTYVRYCPIFCNLAVLTTCGNPVAVRMLTIHLVKKQRSG